MGKWINSGLFKNDVTYKLFIYKSYIFNRYVQTEFGIKLPTQVNMP